MHLCKNMPLCLKMSSASEGLRSQVPYYVLALGPTWGISFPQSLSFVESKNP